MLLLNFLNIFLWSRSSTFIAEFWKAFTVSTSRYGFVFREGHSETNHWALLTAAPQIPPATLPCLYFPHFPRLLLSKTSFHSFPSNALRPKVFPLSPHMPKNSLLNTFCITFVCYNWIANKSRISINSDCGNFLCRFW